MNPQSPIDLGGPIQFGSAPSNTPQTPFSQNGAAHAQPQFDGPETVPQEESVSYEFPGPLRRVQSPMPSGYAQNAGYIQNQAPVINPSLEQVSTPWQNTPTETTESTESKGARSFVFVLIILVVVAAVGSGSYYVYSRFIKNPATASTNNTALNASKSTDTDGDGLLDFEEGQYGTDPNKSDSDGDGYNDGSEVDNGYNPNGSGKLEKKTRF